MPLLPSIIVAIPAAGGKGMKFTPLNIGLFILFVIVVIVLYYVRRRR